MYVMKVKVTFDQEVLGMASADPEIQSNFISSKAPDAPGRSDRITEEIAASSVEETVQKGMTIFPKTEDGKPIFWDYQWRGFFKENCAFLKKSDDPYDAKATLGIKNYKKVIDGNIFVTPRRIVINTNNEPLGKCERSLRAQTMQGERTALASSETVPANSTCEFYILSLNKEFIKAVKEWMDLGILHGTGQWRNSGKGTFLYEVVEEFGVHLTPEEIYVLKKDDKSLIYKQSEILDNAMKRYLSDIAKDKKESDSISLKKDKEDVVEEVKAADVSPEPDKKHRGRPKKSTT